MTHQRVELRNQVSKHDINGEQGITGSPAAAIRAFAPRAMLAALWVLAMTTGVASAQTITNVKVNKDNSDTGVVGGVVKMDIGKKYNGALVINDSAGTYPWKITGKGFGSTAGTATLNAKTVPISSWSDTSITMDLSTKDLNSKAPLDFSSDYTQDLKVKTKAGKAATKSVWWVPAVEGRIFGQCTWWVAKNRKAAKLSVPPYRSYTALSTSWRPARLQGLKWGTANHNALVDAAEALKDGKGKLTGAYKITISEYNGKNANAYYQYAATGNPSKGEYPGASYKDSDKANGYAP